MIDCLVRIMRSLKDEAPEWRFVDQGPPRFKVYWTFDHRRLCARSHACGGYGRGKETGDDIKIIFLSVVRYLKEEGLHPFSLHDLIEDKWLFLRLHTNTFSCVHPAREFTLSDTRFNSMILECGL